MDPFFLRPIIVGPQRNQGHKGSKAQRFSSCLRALVAGLLLRSRPQRFKGTKFGKQETPTLRNKAPVQMIDVSRHDNFFGHPTSAIRHPTPDIRHPTSSSGLPPTICSAIPQENELNLLIVSREFIKLDADKTNTNLQLKKICFTNFTK